MSRFSSVLCCAVIFLLGLGLHAVLSAEDPADSEGGYGEFGEGAYGGGEYGERSEEEPGTEERIYEALDSPLKKPLDFVEVSLNEILEMIEEEYDIPIVFDLAALDEVAISPETEVTIRLREVSLRSALNLMFRQPGAEELAHIIDNEVLLITTLEYAEENLITIPYRVDDLEHYPPIPNGASAWAPYSQLIDTITSCIEIDSWMENGTGQGEIQLIRPGILVVTQTPEVHGRIEDLITELREIHEEMSASSSGKDKQAALSTRGFKVSEDIAKSSQEDQQKVADSIRQSVEWGDESNAKVWIRFVGSRLFVRHCTKTLNQVYLTLSQMDILAPPKIYGGTTPQGGGGFGGGGGGFGGGFGGGGGGGFF